MKTVFMVVLLMLAAGVACAESKLGLYAGLEQRWTKLEQTNEKTGADFNAQPVGFGIVSYEVKPNVYVFGQLNYPFRSELPEYALGLEVSLYSGTVGHAVRGKR